MQSPIRLEPVETFKIPGIMNQVPGDPAGIIAPNRFEDLLSAQLQKPALNDENGGLKGEPERPVVDTSIKKAEEMPVSTAQAMPGEIKGSRNERPVNGEASEEARRPDKSAEKLTGREARESGKFSPALRIGLEKPAPKTALKAAETGREEAVPLEKEAGRSKGRTGDDPGVVINQIMNMLSLLRSLQDPGREAGDLKNALRETRDALIGHKEKFNAGMEEISARLKALIKKIDVADQPGSAGNVLLRNMQSVKDEAVLLADALNLLEKKSGKIGRETGAADPERPENKKAVQDKVILPYSAAGEELREAPVSKNSGNAANFSFQFSKDTQGAEKNHSGNPPTQKPLLFDEQLQSIIHNAKITVRDAKNGTFNLRLYPESLGRINVNMGLDQGTLSGRFLVDSLEVKQALMEQISVIREHLQEAGISVGEFQVNVRDGGRSPFRDDKTTPPARTLHEPRREMSALYESNTLRAHDGAIDMII